jgi:acetyltransferase-like isoleucine patch superfamily enzyme
MLVGLKDWAKRGESPMAQRIWRLAKATRGGAIPVVPAVHKPLYALHLAISGLLSNLARALYWTPLFQSRLEAPAPNLFLYGGMPLVLGRLRLSFGADCRVSAQSTFSGRSSSQDPILTVGRNVDIGWQTTIAVGGRVIIGDNVRIAGRAFLAGYPGHPLDAAARAAGLPDTDDQVGDIVLEDDVWLATGVTVSAGVTIGRGTIVAAGSVVTKDLPAFVLAAGAPAKVVRALPRAE